MRLCLLTGSLPSARCGVGDYTTRLAEQLSSAGEDVTILTAPSPRLEPIPRVEIRPEAPGWSLARLWALVRAIQRQRPDLLHLQYPAKGYGRGLGVTLVFTLLRRLAPRIRRVVTLHEYASFTWRGKLRLRPLLHAADVIVCTTHEDRRALQKRFLGRRPGLRVVPLGSNVGPSSDSGVWQAPPHSQAARPGPVWLAHFGMVMPNKGWELLLHSLLRMPTLLGVLAVGEFSPQQDPYHRRVQNLILGLDLQTRVRFSGFLPRDQVAEAFQTTSGIALLPFSQGASLNRSSLVACLAHGLAVVTTRPQRPLEGLRHGEHLWYVEPRPEAVAAAVERLLTEPDLAGRLRRGALAAAKRHAWPRIAGQMRRAYRFSPAGELAHGT